MTSIVRTEEFTRGDVNAPLFLESDVIKFIDGLTGLGIDGQIFGMMMKLRLELNSMRFGIKQTNGIYLGYFDYPLDKKTVQDFIALEKEGNNLAPYLAQAKQIFNEKTHSFLQIAHGAKQNIVVLISEWSARAHRPQTILLDWANMPEGYEQQALEKRVHNFKEMDQFLADLIYFLESLMRSCPKAYKQFKDLIDQKQKESTASR